MFILFFMLFFFFFKQKTAYEMRISDWSSDVCSSDLHHVLVSAHQRHLRLRKFVPAARRIARRLGLPRLRARRLPGGAQRRRVVQRRARLRTVAAARVSAVRAQCRARRDAGQRRWEEHTSELQSLMSRSYAVYRL